MRLYQIDDVLFMRKNKGIFVYNKTDEKIGFISLIDMPECEKRHAFSFNPETGAPTRMGIKKRGIKNILTATYIVESSKEHFTLKDKPGNSLLYFCVEGIINEQTVRIEENWDKELEIKVNNEHVALVKQHEWTLKTNIQIDDSIKESSILFSVIIFSLFFYKIYNDETNFIENILGEF